MLSIIVTLLILGVMIFVHELGHFVAAKKFGIPVSEFAIGMGPKLKSFKRGDTEYSLRAIPMGGFVDIEGIEVGSVSEHGFNSKKPYQRFIVLFAGVFMNFITAYIVVFALFAVNGEYLPTDKSIVGGVVETSQAYGKLKEGDIIKSVDGIKVEKWQSMVDVVKKHDPQKPLQTVIERTGKEETVTLNLTFNKEDKSYKIGIYPKFEKKSYSVAESVYRSSVEFKNMTLLIFKGFKMLATREVSVKEVKGPVGTVEIVGMFMEQGIIPVLYLAALLSINIGIFNLLPFPGLDGGRIIFVILEKIGINVNKKIEENMHKVGIVFLLFLMALITFNDIWNLFK